MNPSSESWIGRVLGETYEIECVLGQGGMGAVYRARHLRTGGNVAVKVLLRSGVSWDAALLRRFRDEARLIASLRHPHIVHVQDLSEDEQGTPYIVMEYLEGEDLFQYLQRKGILPLEEAIEIAQQVSSALSAAHDKGVVHRDIKPQNIFLLRRALPSGSSSLIKILDFGISKIRRSTQLTPQDSLLGTPHYMAPEAALGQHQSLDGRCDQFSFAVVLFSALAGRLPFDGDELIGILYQIVHAPLPSLQELRPDLPPTFVAAIERALAKDKSHRFDNIADFVRALSGQRSQPEVVPATPSPPLSMSLQVPLQTPRGDTLSLSQGQRKQRWGRGLPSLLPLMVLFTLGGGAFLLQRLLHQEIPRERVQQPNPKQPRAPEDKRVNASAALPLSPVALPAASPALRGPAGTRLATEDSTPVRPKAARSGSAAESRAPSPSDADKRSATLASPPGRPAVPKRKPPPKDALTQEEEAASALLMDHLSSSLGQR